MFPKVLSRTEDREGSNPSTLLPNFVQTQPKQLLIIYFHIRRLRSLFTVSDQYSALEDFAQHKKMRFFEGKLSTVFIRRLD